MAGVGLGFSRGPGLVWVREDIQYGSGLRKGLFAPREQERLVWASKRVKHQHWYVRYSGQLVYTPFLAHTRPGLCPMSYPKCIPAISWLISALHWLCIN